MEENHQKIILDLITGRRSEFEHGPGWDYVAFHELGPDALVFRQINPEILKKYTILYELQGELSIDTLDGCFVINQDADASIIHISTLENEGQSVEDMLSGKVPLCIAIYKQLALKEKKSLIGVKDSSVPLEEIAQKHFRNVLYQQSRFLNRFVDSGKFTKEQLEQIVRERLQKKIIPQIFPEGRHNKNDWDYIIFGTKNPDLALFRQRDGWVEQVDIYFELRSGTRIKKKLLGQYKTLFHSYGKTPLGMTTKEYYQLWLPGRDEPQQERDCIGYEAGSLVCVFNEDVCLKTIAKQHIHYYQQHVNKES